MSTRQHRAFFDQSPRLAAIPISQRPADRTRLRWEIVIVLSLSLGASAVYAIISIAQLLAQPAALSEQTSAINTSMSQQPIFDLLYQLRSFVFGLAPVALVVFLLWQRRRPHLERFGIAATPHHRRTWWARDAAAGLGLAALIGIPGLGFYVFAKAIGINTTVVVSSLDAHWWTVPVLVLMAIKAALLEESIVVVHLFDRLKRLGVGPLAVVLASAVLRGSYHLYQGFGGFIGNVVMGLVFGWAYHRWGRALPLIVAHAVLDIVSFAGYSLAVAWWPQLFAA